MPTNAALRSASQLWTSTTNHKKRAIAFIVVFFLLLTLRANESNPGTNVFYPHHQDPQTINWHAVIADVPRYKVYAVADNDSKEGNGASDGKLSSALLEGQLKVTRTSKSSPATYSFEWHSTPAKLTGSLTGPDGRGMELSTLQYWRHGKLYACDDHTGVIYEVMVEEGVSPKAVPRFIVADGDGNVEGGMKCEWSTVKGDFLMIGSTGKPWTTESGVEKHRNGQWVKLINPAGTIRNVNWREPYDSMRGALGVAEKGYIMHQCAVWSSLRQRWYFIPRHVSYTSYKPGDELVHGSTVIIVTDANFKTIRVVTLETGDSPPEAGVTECKFIPNGHEKEIVLVKAIEKGSPATFRSTVSVVDITGKLLMRDTALPEGYKLEGLEMLPLVHDDR